MMQCADHPERAAAFWAYARDADQRPTNLAVALCLECMERGVDAGIPENEIWALGRKRPA